MPAKNNIFIIILFFSHPLSALEKIGGVVQDEQTKEPIIGVNISLVGSEIGTVTDINGLFELVVPDDKQPNLRLSHIGYETREASIDSSYAGVLLLTPAVIKGQEIEVVGVKSKTEMDLALFPILTVVKLLQSLKTPPIFMTPLPIVTLVRLLQPENILVPLPLPS